MKQIINQLSKELKVDKSQVKSTIKLIDEGNTIPFIARYRKEMTGGLSDVVLRKLNNRLEYLRNLEQEKKNVIKKIDDQDKLTPKLKKKILKAKTKQQVTDLYRPYKKKRKTRASKAIDKGLKPLSDLILKQNIFEGKIEKYAKKYLDEEKDLNKVEDVLNGANDIIAEIVSDDPNYRKYIRSFVRRYGVLKTEVKNKEKDEKDVYKIYYDYKQKLKEIPEHRILAIDRAEDEKIIRVKILVDEESILDYLYNKVITDKKSIFSDLIKEAIDDSFSRLIFPSVERTMRRWLTEKAQKNAIEVFSNNTKSLLMIPPVEGMRVLAIDPSYRTGCKIVTLDKFGKLLDYATIYPNPPQNEKEKSKKILKDLIDKYDINIIPIGNGTASRETALFVGNIIKNLDREIYYTIVSEDGASVYSASKVAQKEFPDINVSIRGAISIGRRLQDPLAELVKIDPMSIGVGQYQHDLNKKELRGALKGVIEDCVNKVGVDLNTASPTLLKYISGISSSVSQNIVEFRQENSKFTKRSELKKVNRLGPKTYKQCAGFLRIRKAKNVLDNTGVHPESYKSTKNMLKLLGYSLKDVENKNLDEINVKIKEFGGYKKLSDKLDIGVLTLKDIVKELLKPGRDPREEMPKPVFKSEVLTIEDLKKDMVLKGTVKNVVNFGCFVDIGIKQDGLVHISELSDSYVDAPLDIVSVGDIVNVKILDIDIDRQRIQLSMKNI